METLLKADIFFFITSVAVILLTVGAIVALYYVIRILQSVRNISERVEEGSKVLGEDLDELRFKLKTGGVSARLFSGLFRSTRKWFGREAAKRESRKENS
jgi:hypothetical protein